MLLALVLRLDGLGFGLPALLDPDEPTFVLTALRLLKDHTLDPGWFGHPGTTTIYALALIEIGVVLAGMATGRFATPQDFGRAVYADPRVVFLPGRVFILLCGLATIVLTMMVARRLFGPRVACVAGLLLAVDPIHVRYSQIIRTDMHATIFVLLQILAGLAIVRRGRRRDYLFAALWLGLACATKWPAGAAAAGVIGAAALRWRQHPGEGRAIARNLALYAAAAPAALVTASPYLVLDWRTVASNLQGEERPFHLGATGHGFVGNLGWYVDDPLTLALGVAGLVLAAAGLAIGTRRSRPFLAVVVPVLVVFLAMISAQALIWERWVVPILPILSVAVAVAVVRLPAALAGRRLGGLGQARARWVASAALLAVVAVPTFVTARAQARERATDTRRLATAWASRHVAPGSTVVVEHLAFDVLGQPWRFLYPVGDEGCVDVRAALHGQVRFSTIGRWRGTRPVVDIGTVARPRLATCRADWAILIDWDRYRAEPGDHFGSEIATYAAFVHDGGGRVVATFAPVTGEVGGPVVRVVRFAAAASQPAQAVVPRAPASRGSSGTPTLAARSA